MVHVCSLSLSSDVESSSKTRGLIFLMQIRFAGGMEEGIEGYASG